MALYLGFDAGGTKTECALAEDDRILARAMGGGIKPTRVSIEEAQRNIASLLLEIAEQSGKNLKHVAASCIGTSGVRMPQTSGWMRQILSECASGEIIVCGDEEIALDAAFPGEAGVLIMAGTGSNILGRTSKGERLNVGGWGPILGDEGSGYWIGHQALRASCYAHDFQRPVMLLDRVMQFWNAHSLGEIVSIATATPPPDFSKLAKLVIECAEAGDAVCFGILEQGGRLLGECAIEAFRRVRTLEPAAVLPGIAFTGSILKNVQMVRQAMIDTIHQALPTVHIEPEAVDPVMGALWRARQAVKA